LISGETDWLKEDWEAFLPEWACGCTQSPALHPDDVQLVQAVILPQSSALWNLRNCIVFSQNGLRDLPSMLSGGDLDGDLYNIIYDEQLMGKRIRGNSQGK